MHRHYHNELLAFAQEKKIGFKELCTLVDLIVRNELQKCLKTYIDKVTTGVASVTAMDLVPATYDSLSRAMTKLLGEGMTVEQLAKKID